MKINFGALSAYIFTVIISVLFMLFLDGPGGSYLLIALVSALIISFVVFFWTVKTLKYELTVSEDILNKNECLEAILNIKKEGFLPTAFIKFSFNSTVHFSSENEENNCIIIFGQDSYDIRKTYKSVFFGSGYINIENLTISDYLGIFTFNLRDSGKFLNNSSPLLKPVKVYPDIPDINGRDDFARSLTDAVSFDDSEETSQSMVSINGVPGYDHRKYVPGDNLKLINWKISAKRGELLVRQLEGTGSTEQVFVLIRDDLYFEESQLAAEAMLGMAMIFAKAELPVKVVVYIHETDSETEWQEISVQNVSELFELRYKMTDYNIFYLKNFLNGEKVEENLSLRTVAVPYSVEGNRAVIFAPVYDENLVAFMDRLSSEGKEYQVAVCSGEITDNKTRKIERDNLSVRFSG